MDKKTPTKRKSIANTNTPKPNKLQKTVNTPVSQKKNNKSPKSANKNNKKSPQGKQLNGKQNTPKGKKAPKQPKPEPVEDEEVENESEENETDNSIEQENGDNSVVETNSNDEENDEVDDNEDVVEKNKPGKNDEARKFSVYVGGLNGNITEKQLRGFFNGSNITSVFMLKSGPEEKFLSAFVNFEDEASREKALANNGTELKGCTIKVVLPKSKPRLPPAEYKSKNMLLQQLKQQVRKLENELGKRPSYSRFQKPTNFKQGMKGKFTGKNKANKKPFKKE